MYYLITIAAFFVSFLALCLIDRKVKGKMDITWKILSIVLVVLFFVWYMLPGIGAMRPTQGNMLRDVYKLDTGSPFDGNSEFKSFLGTKFVTALALLGVWFLVILHTISVLAPYFGEFKVAKNVEKYISPVLVVFDILVIPNIIFTFSGVAGFSAVGLLICLEIGLIAAKLVFSFYKGYFKFKFEKSDLKEFLIAIFVLLLWGMPCFLPKAFLGDIKLPPGGIVDFGQYHRIFIYIEFGYLIAITLLLRNRKGEYSRMVLLTMSFLAMITYSFTNVGGFAEFDEPWAWPIQICNTAMFILPITLAFKSEKVFYFTFFVNILGAMLASFMPTYSSSLNVIAERTLSFWSNHFEAFAMPLICVLLGVYSRPSKKQFFYSMVGFTIYFIFVLIINTVLTGYRPIYAEKHGWGNTYGIPDFFFLNSTFIAEKVNGEKVFENFTWTFRAFGMDLTFHPLYQLIYYFGFIAMSIGMWYIYVYLFKFQDALIDINHKYNKIKLDELALCEKYHKKEVALCMSEISKDKLIISHFGKRYSENAPFAVRDINFEAKGGEIIGFLGPNGAGKSTTIKAIVGIHLPTEGTIEVNGYDVVTQPVQAKAQLGFVPDHYALYENLTGREYLNYIADLYDVSKKDRNAFLDEFLETLQMKKAINKKMQTYSHGMKQKIAIMASIIHNPKLWILDEPLTGLDPVSIYQVKQCLKNHAEKGNIVFFSSHLIDIVEKLCDKIVIISDHKVQDIANVHDLLEKGVNLEQYYMKKTGQQTGDK